MNIATVHEYIEKNKEKYITLIKELVSQPSVTSNAEDVRKCALLIREKMLDAGIAVTLIETSGNPIVYGEVKSKIYDAATLLFYGHYDVQAEGEQSLWSSPPFSPEIRNGRIYGRGTADNKAQFIAHLAAVDAYLSLYGDIPVNVKFVLDGEEENGSRSLKEFATANRNFLLADLAYTSDGALGANNKPTAIFGARGVINFDMSLKTGDVDNHSGNKGGVIENPIWEMIHILSKMMNKDGHILIPGFYENVTPVTEAEVCQIKCLPFEKDCLKNTFRVNTILAKDAVDYYNRLMFLPTLTLNGISGGYTENGCKNIIPNEVTAKMEIRLVWKQNPQDIFKLVKDFVKQQRPDIMVDIVGDAMYPSKSSIDLPIFTPVISAVEQIFGEPPQIMPISAGSLPDYIWTQLVKIPSILIPYGNIDENNHAPDENIALDLFSKGMHTSAQVINNLSSYKSKLR